MLPLLSGLVLVASQLAPAPSIPSFPLRKATAATALLFQLFLFVGPAAAVTSNARHAASSNVKMAGRVANASQIRQARQADTPCEVADFAPMMPIMPEGCGDMIMAAAATGVMPSTATVCGCLAPVNVDDMPGCAFGGWIFGADTHGSCVAMVAATGTASPTSVVL